MSDDRHRLRDANAASENSRAAHHERGRRPRRSLGRSALQIWKPSLGAARSDGRRRARCYLGEDVGARGNVFLITTGFLQEFGARRVIDMPLAEASIVGIAVGMAMQGLRPIAEIQFADFIYPAFNQIVGEAAKTRYRSNGEYSCPLVIRTPYGGGVHGALSHSVSIEALFYHVPGLKIVAPSTPLRHQGPVDGRDRGPRSGALPRAQEDVSLGEGRGSEGHFTIPIGKADVKKPGTQLTVVSYGYNLHQALDAARELETEGVSIEVIDLRSIRPMDKTTILTSVRKTRKLLIIHEDNKFGGIGAEISAMVSEEALFELDAPIRRLCGPDVPAMGYAKPLEEAFMISTERMRDRDAGPGALLMATTISYAAIGRDRHRRHRRALAQAARRPASTKYEAVRRGLDR